MASAGVWGSSNQMEPSNVVRAPPFISYLNCVPSATDTDNRARVEISAARL